MEIMKNKKAVTMVSLNTSFSAPLFVRKGSPPTPPDNPPLLLWSKIRPIRAMELIS